MAISFAPFAQDLATAMVIVRSSRQKTGPVDLILKSLDYVSHKDELQRKREQSESQKGWSEVYVHNVFLSRFIDVKYHDNSLAIEENLSGSEKDGLNEFAVQKAWSILPTPVANFFGVEINKDTLGKESFGDFLYASSTGQESLGLKAGSYIANGLGLHGLLFFPILALFCVVLFTLFDSFVVKAVEDSQNGGPPTESLLVSPIALLNVYLLCGMFLGLNGHESEVAFLAWIVRDFGQMVILYFVIFKITEGLVFIVTLGSTRRKASRARIRALGRSG